LDHKKENERRKEEQRKEKERRPERTRRKKEGGMDEKRTKMWVGGWIGVGGG